jgi:hypothetical protein
MIGALCNSLNAFSRILVILGLINSPPTPNYNIQRQRFSTIHFIKIIIVYHIPIRNYSYKFIKESMPHHAVSAFESSDFAHGAVLGLRPPVSASIWPLLDSDAVMLFHYAYSDEYKFHHWVNSFLFRKLSFVFTPTIQPPLLRYSILAYLAHYGPSHGLAVKEEQYRRIALRILALKLRTCNIDEADLFAAYFLALRTTWHSLDSIQHYRGCLNIYRYLLQKQTASISLFAVYGPFIFHELNTWLNTELALRSNVPTSSSQQIHIEWPPFDLFLQHIIPFSSEEWPPLLLASVLLLWYYLRLLASSIVRVVDGQCHGDSEKDHIAKALVEAMKRQFYHAQLQDFLIATEKKSEEAIQQIE